MPELIIANGDGDPVIQIESISINQAEGVPHRLIKKTVKTAVEANKLLCDIARDGPELGYYKTDVLVKWTDGVELQTRHDVMRWDACKIGGNDTHVGSHLMRFAKFVLENQTNEDWNFSGETIRLASEIIRGARDIA